MAPPTTLTTQVNADFLSFYASFAAVGLTSTTNWSPANPAISTGAGKLMCNIGNWGGVVEAEVAIQAGFGLVVGDDNAGGNPGVLFDIIQVSGQLYFRLGTNYAMLAGAVVPAGGCGITEVPCLLAPGTVATFVLAVRHEGYAVSLNGKVILWLVNTDRGAGYTLNARTGGAWAGARATQSGVTVRKLKVKQATLYGFGLTKTTIFQDDFDRSNRVWDPANASPTVYPGVEYAGVTNNIQGNQLQIITTGSPQPAVETVLGSDPEATVGTYEFGQVYYLSWVHVSGTYRLTLSFVNGQQADFFINTSLTGASSTLCTGTFDGKSSTWSFANARGGSIGSGVTLELRWFSLYTATVNPLGGVPFDPSLSFEIWANGTLLGTAFVLGSAVSNYFSGLSMGATSQGSGLIDQLKLQRGPIGDLYAAAASQPVNLASSGVDGPGRYDVDGNAHTRPFGGTPAILYRGTKFAYESVEVG